MSATAFADPIAGRYQISARIASGGMGEVFRAWDASLRRTVALKVLKLDDKASPGRIARFKSEAQAAARLSHPNVVQVHDWGESNGTYFMVMEYVRGRNLREVLASKTKLPGGQAAELMSLVLGALEAAHSRGLVHRDIKPENILVTVEGGVKVADFGIARAVEDASGTSGLVGTVAYVSPEQARGEAIDRRSDIYSAGCVLFELITGMKPYEGDAASVLRQHLTERVKPPSEVAGGSHNDIDDVVAKSTAPQVDDRYASAAEMRNDLLTIVKETDSHPPLAELSRELTSEVSPSFLDTEVPEERRRRRIKWWHIAIAVFLVAGAWAGWTLRPVTVPAVEGLTISEARETLEELALGVVVESRDSTQPIGTILESEPKAGDRVRWHGTVTLFASNGPPDTTLGDLTGLTLDEAKEAIEAAGLRVGLATRKNDPAEAGLVIDQDPKPGTIERGTHVNLVVSLGPETIAVPNAVGKTFEQASAILTKAGFEVTREDAFNDAEEETVVGQNPAAGKKVEKGSAVTLVVSQGPEPFAMPDVKGKACTDAKAELEGLGLVVVVTSRGAGCGANPVLDQDPFAGASVKKGQEATLFTS